MPVLSVKSADRYSNACSVMKHRPSAIVMARPRASCLRSLRIRPQCAQVTVTPELSRIKVLTAGMPQAPMGVKGACKPGPAVGQPAT